MSVVPSEGAVMAPPEGASVPLVDGAECVPAGMMPNALGGERARTLWRSLKNPLGTLDAWERHIALRREETKFAAGK